MNPIIDHKLTPLNEIFIPEVKTSTDNEQYYEITLLGKNFQFNGLKKLLGAADFNKAGDRHTKLAARDDAEREAARTILSNLSLEYIYNHPLLDEKGKVDFVMKVGYDIDLDRFSQIKKLTLSELKDELLKLTNATIKSKFIGALTPVMVAAVSKLMDTHEFVFISKKIRNITKARTTLGQKGILASRLQPNHPTDDLRGISALSYLGLSMGSGDCLMGVNPAIDTVDNISKILHHLNKIRQKTGAPTQICVLSHIKTQMQCLEQGAPVEIMFQSLAGTESTNVSEFDITIETLDAAYELMKKQGPLGKIAPQFMYFETGQGSEFTYGKHNGCDMATLEALCYGLARRYDPYMVNNVTGFIGPETHADNFEMVISSLQDHFMGKLLGLPMGMAPCYTLHSKIDLEGQQMATQMLTAAGANYYMDVYLNTDRMLAYFDTSAHDNQTLREIYDCEPTPEFKEWAVAKKIYQISEGKLIRGSNWGDPKIFVDTEAELNELLKITPSYYGSENAGPKPSNHVTRQVRSDQAFARAAIYSELDIEKLKMNQKFITIQTQAHSKEEHLKSPDLGSLISESSLINLKKENKNVQIVVSDGLSAEAVHANLKDLLPVLMDGLRAKKISFGVPILAPYGRVKLSEAVAKAVGCDLVISLIGERPGGTAEASRSLSCYFTYQLKDQDSRTLAKNFSGHSRIEFEYSVVSNIYSLGLPPLEAGSVLVNMAEKILNYRAAGNRLERILNKRDSL